MGFEIKKINVGFTNLVYSAGNKYIIKICNNKLIKMIGERQEIGNQVGTIIWIEKR